MESFDHLTLAFVTVVPYNLKKIVCAVLLREALCRSVRVKIKSATGWGCRYIIFEGAEMIWLKY